MPDSSDDRVQDAGAADWNTSAEARASVSIGYQAAVSLIAYEGSLIWSKFNAMLVANSIYVAVIAGAIDGDPFEDATIYLLCVAGFCMSAVWALLTKRGFDNYVYWILSARELEECFLQPVTLLAAGGSFAGGETVTRLIGGAPQTISMSWVSCRLRAASLSYVAITLFAIVYVALIIAA